MTCICTYVYTALRVNLIVLFRGTDCSRAATVFPIWCRSKPRLEATKKQLAIRLSALSIRSSGVYTVARKDSDRKKYEHTYTPLSRRDSVFRCVVTITVSRWTAAHSFRRPGNRYVCPTTLRRSPSDISIAQTWRTFRLSRDLHVSLIYPRLEFSPQDAISFVKIMILV